MSIDQIMQVILQIAAIVIAGGVIWVARGVAEMNTRVALLTERVDRVCNDIQSLERNHVTLTRYDRDHAEVAKSIESLSAHFFRLKEEHIACRCCADARAKLPAV